MSVHHENEVQSAAATVQEPSMQCQERLMQYNTVYFSSMLLGAAGLFVHQRQ